MLTTQLEAARINAFEHSEATTPPCDKSEYADPDEECKVCGWTGHDHVEYQALKTSQHLRMLAIALVRKLRECEPYIGSAFTMLNVHGGKYVGPTYGGELKALEDALLAP